jgi:hypothetical protein
MSVYQIDWHWFQAQGGSGYYTIDVNIPPAMVGAQTALYGQAGGGANITGIPGYRKRLNDGSDQDIEFGDYGNWPPLITDYISSVTFGIAIGSDQQTLLVARMDYWS